MKFIFEYQFDTVMKTHLKPHIQSDIYSRYFFKLKITQSHLQLHLSSGMTRDLVGGLMKTCEKNEFRQSLLGLNKLIGEPNYSSHVLRTYNEDQVGPVYPGYYIGTLYGQGGNYQLPSLPPAHQTSK